MCTFLSPDCIVFINRRTYLSHSLNSELDVELKAVRGNVYQECQLLLVSLLVNFLGKLFKQETGN